MAAKESWIVSLTCFLNPEIGSVQIRPWQAAKQPRFLHRVWANGQITHPLDFARYVVLLVHEIRTESETNL